jgi:hypothetical protein
MTKNLFRGLAIALLLGAPMVADNAARSWVTQTAADYRSR